MITPEQAREEYGFVECTNRENNLALGLYNAAYGLFPTTGMRLVDIVAPFIVFFLMCAVLLGIVTTGAKAMLLLVLGAMGFVFVPRYVRLWNMRAQNSGMLHIQSIQGEQFLIARGICVEKKVVLRKSFFNRINDYKLRVRVAKNCYLDDVLIMKELYDQVEEGTQVCLMMADSPNAKQIIAAPNNFTETVIDKKRIAMQQFETVDPRTVRELSDAERAMYIRQYKERVALWEKNYQRIYLIIIILCLLLGCAALVFLLQAVTILCWVAVLCAVFALRAQKKDFRRHLKYMDTAQPLTAVDVTVYREDGYRRSMGVEKRPNSCVNFKDATGSILWTLRTAEDLRTFAHREKAVLIVHDKELIPLHRDTALYSMQGLHAAAENNGEAAEKTS